MVASILAEINPDVAGWWLEILPGLLFILLILIAWAIFWLTKTSEEKK